MCCEPKDTMVWADYISYAEELEHFQDHLGNDMRL